jgi:hypothetical protein
LAAGSAQALTLSCSTGSTSSSATFTLNEATQAACISGQGSAGNDTPTINSAYSLFGMTGWVLSQKNDGAEGDKVITFATAPVNGTKSGSWAVNSFAGLANVVLTLKAGDGFAAFLLDTNFLSGKWWSTKNLSHASIYYNGTPSQVPLPAAGLLLAGALGGLGVFGAKRKLSVKA